MPYCEIPPESLEHLGLFGIDVLHETPTALIVRCVKGDGHIEYPVDKLRPHIWFDDIADAIQMGTKAIVPMPGK